MYAFNEMGMHKLDGHIYEINKISIKIFEKFGAEKEVILRNWVRKDGQLIDTFVYGILAQDAKKY